MRALTRLFRRAAPRDPAVNDPDWDEVIARHHFLRALPRADQQKLRALCDEFIARKHFEGVGGLKVGDAMRLAIAAQACLPVLELGLEWYRDWVEIIVYPAQFVPRREVEDEYGIVHVVEEPLAGEAWLGGPVLLSWEDVEAAPESVCYNVVIHEFAHKLDMLNGEPDGHPPLHAGMSPRAWHAALDAAYRAFVARVDASPDPDNDPQFVIDPYAAENPGEFFAVLSEAFFDIPETLAQQFPELYAQFVAFYRQDPLRRVSATLTGT